MSEVSLRIALIGAGYFSQFHRDAWERIDRAQIVAVMDKVPERCRSYTLSRF
jgi:predicted dehydrogenase